jgi:hypothetical protein
MRMCEHDDVMPIWSLGILKRLETKIDAVQVLDAHFLLDNFIVLRMQ